MSSKNEAWDKRYAKWDKFEAEDEDDVVSAPPVPTLLDHTGDEDIVVKDVIHISDEKLHKLNQLDQQEKEIWQVVVRKLRVWSASSSGAAEGPNAIPCRPYCILVNNLYPMGQVYTKDVNLPPEEYPSVDNVLKRTVDAIFNPPKGMLQHRPGKIVFPDRSFVGELRKTYGAMGIECSYLSESQGVDEYVKAYSEMLIKSDMASTGDGFYKACASFAQDKPWKKIFERRAIRLDAPELRVNEKLVIPAGRVWATVLGASGTNSEGIALFYAREDLQRRAVPVGTKIGAIEEPKMRRCGYCDNTPLQAGNELKKCTRCQTVFYCNATCQRSAWPRHKKTCAAPKSGSSEMVWPLKEVSLLFGSLTMVPFDDLDAVDKYDLPLSTSLAPHSYPICMQIKKGNPDVPEAADLIWLERVIIAFTTMLKEAPTYMEKSMIVPMGEEYEPLEVGASTSCLPEGKTEALLLHNSTVLTWEEVQKLQEALK